MRNFTILIVDDEVSFIRPTQETLELDGYEVKSVRTGEEALNFVNDNDLPDLILLDVVLPGMDGFECLRELQKTCSTPVILVSGKRLSAEDKEKGINMGARDYVTKPLKYGEFQARVRSVLSHNYHEKIPEPRRLNFRDSYLEIDLAAKQIKVKGSEVELAPHECALLEELISNRGKVLSYKHLLHKVWGPEFGIETNYLHEYIKRLRIKIEPDPKYPQYIINKPRAGYIFTGELCSIPDYQI